MTAPRNSPRPLPRIAPRLLALVMVLIAGTVAFADPTGLVDAFDHRPSGATGTVLVPDRFLRSWDPVTIFFSQSTGPSKPGPEDQPERHVRFSPEHPGAFTWIDSKTLQFKPSEPWPPLAQYSWRVGSRSSPIAGCVWTCLLSCSRLARRSSLAAADQWMSRRPK